MQGRLLMWGWLQERRKVGSYDYAGCLSVPRIMYLRGDRLHQEPAPEVRTQLTPHHENLQYCQSNGSAQSKVLENLKVSHLHLCFMRVQYTTKALAKRMLKHYRIL